MEQLFLRDAKPDSAGWIKFSEKTTKVLTWHFHNTTDMDLWAVFHSGYAKDGTPKLLSIFCPANTIVREPSTGAAQLVLKNGAFLIFSKSLPDWTKKNLPEQVKNPFQEGITGMIGFD
jgi:hypothetical protein